MRDSERYMAQAETVLRMANRAGTPAERQVYQSIADGWRKLAAEARRHEQQQDRVTPIKPEPRTFHDR